MAAAAVGLSEKKAFFYMHVDSLHIKSFSLS
jgi:hypothetical protein